LPEKSNIRAKVVISYKGNSPGSFQIEVPSEFYIRLLRDFLKGAKIEGEDLTLNDVLKIEIVK